MSVIDMDLKKLMQELEDYQNLTDSLREQLERAFKENSTLIDDNNLVHRKITSIKQELSKNNNEYSRLENELYQANQELERLKKENIQYLKNKREIERKLREETQSYEKDRILWHERESELLEQSRAFQETLNVLAQQSEQSLQKKDEILSANHYSNARELRNAQKQIKELEHKVGELESELVKSKQTSTESINFNKNHVRKIQQLENEISQIKHMNHTLMEDNEGYQLLLHEKTIKGEFTILQLGDYNIKHSDKVEKVTDNITKDDYDKDSQKLEDSSFKNKLINHSDLSSELDRAKALTVTLQGESVYKESDHTIAEKLQDEIKSLRDANKSMQLYIQKILNRIMEAKGFEELLSSDWSAGFIDDQNEKKHERRKTLSEFHNRANSQPQNNYNNISPDTKILTEEPESLEPSSPDSNHKGLILTKGLAAPKRPQRSKSISHTKSNATTNTNSHSKRFSIFDWVGGSGKESSKKDDPYMKPIMLLKENSKN